MEDHHPTQPHQVRRPNTHAYTRPLIPLPCACRNIKRLLEVLQEEWESSLQTTTTTSIAKGKGVAGRTPNSPGVRFSTSKLTDNHRRIRMRLSALLPIEDELMKKLLPDGGAAAKDVCVRAGSGWKGIVSALSENTSTLGPVVSVKPLVSAMKGAANSRPNTADARFKDNPTAVLAACKDDIVTIWEDHVVQDVLKKHNIRLQDMPGFFMNDAGRIAAINYEATDGARALFSVRVRPLNLGQMILSVRESARSVWKSTISQWKVVRFLEQSGTSTTLVEAAAAYVYSSFVHIS